MKGLLFIILASFLWALDSLIRYPLLTNGISAEILVFYEHIILCGVFSYFFFVNFKKILSLQLEDIIYFIILGVGGSAIATLAFTKAFIFINPSLVILIQKFQPIVAVILARFVLSEKIRPQFLIWAGICLAGVILIGIEDLLKGLSELDRRSLFEVQSIKGYGLTLVAVLGWGASTVFGKKLSLRGFKENEIMGGRFLFALFALTPVVMNSGASMEINFSEGLKILILVLISGLLGMFFYYRGLKYVSARVGTLGELFFPLAAVILNWVFLGVTVSAIQVLGGAILFFGASMIQYKKY